uniref:Cysteine dioxygenase n=1 Tax=Globisporangium ultimum (strain ATCC 200006 / CBS 805.95 / DAOM BR144) TaxID=431595 RepID=K3WU36_GLOUD
MSTQVCVSVTDAANRVEGNQTQGSPAAAEIRKIAALRTDMSSNQRQDQTSDETKLSLEQLVEEVDQLLKEPEMSTTPMKKQPVFQSLLDGDMRELERFAYADTSKNYTRNLIATDNETYALILIVWNRGKYSPIHDHPCDGCWVKVINGAINEVRYVSQDGKLVESSNVTLDQGVTYMDDSMGFHKIGNPSATVDATTLHLYSPPYDKCRVWFDTENADKSSVAHAYYFSEFGERADY